MFHGATVPLWPGPSEIHSLWGSDLQNAEQLSFLGLIQTEKITGVILWASSQARVTGPSTKILFLLYISMSQKIIENGLAAKKINQNITEYSQRELIFFLWR